MKPNSFLIAAGILLAMAFVSCSDSGDSNGVSNYGNALPSSGSVGNSWNTNIPWNPNIRYGELTDERDGKVYRVAVIGSQTWMAENLNYETRIGSECYQYKESNCDKYGRLYDWETAIESCPDGWHLAYKSEWQTLYNFVHLYEVPSASHLKAMEGWDDISPELMSLYDWTEPNGNGDDLYGFTALPGGISGRSGGFGAIGETGYWWTANETNSYTTSAHDVSISNSPPKGDFTIREYQTLSKSYMMSVRCILD